MKRKKIFVVIPTVRNLQFLRSWGNQFRDCSAVIVEDRPKKEITTPNKYFQKVHHYCWQDIDQELGNNNWIIPRKNSGIRCFGFLKAWQLGAEVVISLDDDCYPVNKNFVKQHLGNLSTKAPQKWFSTFPHPDYNFSRGFPYQVRNKYSVVLSHGLWSGALDLDGKTEKKFGRPDLPGFNLPLRQFIPFGYYFPMCIMNLAFTRKIIPLMYMPLMGQDADGKKWDYDRFDDIWAGVMVKRILDHLGLAVVSGSPLVEHRKKTSIEQCLKREEAGLKMNEKFWQMIDKINLNSKTIENAYKELVNKIVFPRKQYFNHLKKAILIWINLF